MCNKDPRAKNLFQLFSALLSINTASLDGTLAHCCPDVIDGLWRDVGDVEWNLKTYGHESSLYWSDEHRGYLVKSLPNLEYLRGFAALLVFLSHFAQNFSLNGTTSWRFLESFGNFGVDLFLFYLDS